MRRKGTFRPLSVAINGLLDPALVDPTAAHYIVEAVLPAIRDRLIDPTFDEPSCHLRFEPAIHGYVVEKLDHGQRSPLGKLTQHRFFSDKEDAEWWEKVSDRVRRDVQTAPSPAALECALNETIALIGCSFYVRAYAFYWTQLSPPSWCAE